MAEPKLPIEFSGLARQIAYAILYDAHVNLVKAGYVAASFREPLDMVLTALTELEAASWLTLKPSRKYGPKVWQVNRAVFAFPRHDSEGRAPTQYLHGR